MKKSSKVALCGMIAALCTLLMFMTGVFPFATYAMPVLAGLLMVAVAVETGASWAFTLYGAVSILSFLLTPDKEAMLMFIMFFGHYPITKFWLEKIKLKPLALLCKLLCFNFCIVIAYLLIIFVFRIPDILTEFGDFGKYSVYIMFVLDNILFFVYDFALTQIMNAYIYFFRPKFLRRTSK